MRIQAVNYVRATIGDEMRTLCDDTSSESGPISGASDVSVAVSRIWDKIYSKIAVTRNHVVGS
jgi:hypothetical protein